MLPSGELMSSRTSGHPLGPLCRTVHTGLLYTALLHADSQVIRTPSEESEGPDGDRRRDPDIAASSRCASVWPCRPAASEGPGGPAAIPAGADRQSGSTATSLEAQGSAEPRLDPPDAAACAA